MFEVEKYELFHFMFFTVLRARIRVGKTEDRRRYLWRSVLFFCMDDFLFYVYFHPLTLSICKENSSTDSDIYIVYRAI